MPNPLFPWEPSGAVILRKYAAAEVACAHHRNHKLPQLQKSTATDWASSQDMIDADDENGATPDDIGILHWKMVSTPKFCKDTRSAWDSTGALKISRMPRGKPPVARAHGVLWLYMIGSYVLLGDGMAQYMPWRLGNSRAPDYNGIKIGYIAVHPDVPDDS
ncbi:hypothetical protein N7454_002589 [Penicillium verhagenii]|nr:hypothetical protein N7454_002589 [Penicillium verhagenii]